MIPETLLQIMSRSMEPEVNQNDIAEIRLLEGEGETSKALYSVFNETRDITVRSRAFSALVLGEFKGASEIVDMIIDNDADWKVALYILCNDYGLEECLQKARADLVSDGDPDVVSGCIKLIGSYGDEEDVPKLAILADNEIEDSMGFPLGPMARSAIEEIRERNRI